MNPFNLVFISLISSGNDILNEKSSSHFWSSLIIIYHLFSIMLLLILYFYSIILLCRMCIICTKYNFILIRIPLKRKKFLKWIYLSVFPTSYIFFRNGYFKMDLELNQIKCEISFERRIEIFIHFSNLHHIFVFI